MAKRDECETNPTWAMVGFSRQSGAQRLFGSDITHHTCVSLRITPCEVYRDLNETRMYGGNSPMVEVVLSDMQFAELLTTMNVGSGVPCTVRVHPQHGYLKYDAPKDNERDKINRELTGQCEKAMSSLDDVVAQINTLPLSAKAKKALLSTVEVARRSITGHLPFIETQYKEAMDRLEREAKAAVDGFITHAIHSTGLDTLNQLRGLENPGPLLIEGSAYEEGEEL
jgi:hypothetical protein